MTEAFPTRNSNRPTTNQKPKLRRKVATEDRMEEPTAIQRLVEYFVVVSSQPRWENERLKGNSYYIASESFKKVASLRGGLNGATKALTCRRLVSTNPSPECNRQPESRDEETPTDDGAGNIHMPLNALEYTFKPAITARFPQVDYPENPLNPMILQFCYPHSDEIVPSTSYVLPKIHHFVLTNEKGRKIYGTCLTIYEEYDASADEPFSRKHKVHANTGEDDIEVSVDSEKGTTLYIPRVLCLISYWPYLTAFREYLTQLYRLASTTDMMHAPLERYILNICLEIPAPPPGAFEVHIQILQSTIKFWAPPAKLPIAYVALPYQVLFDCLEINNVLLVWYALVMEQKVLLLSSQYSILTICSEILCSLLFPMQWSHLYIPMLPKFLSPMLDAPIPYLVGVIRENLMYAEGYVSAETIVVDLDSNKVTLGRNTPKLSSPPSRKWNKLQAALEQNAGELFWKTRCLDAEYQMVVKGKMSPSSFRMLYDVKGNVGWKEKLKGFDDAFSMAYLPDSVHAAQDTGDDGQSRWDKVQEAFLRFFVSTLKMYRKFLHLPETSGTEVTDAKVGRWSNNRRTFDRSGFIVWQKVEQQPFYQELCMTQQFDDFITKRMYNPEVADAIFFDQSIDAKNNRSRLKIKKVETPFLQSAKAHKVLKTFQAVEPNEEFLPVNELMGQIRQTSYRYESWPECFDSSLFGEPRPIPKIITAEFDRQSSLAQRLHSTLEVNLGNDFVDFFGADFDPSPEVATYTIFFFCYGAVVGLEWQDYQREKMRNDVHALEVAKRNTNASQPSGPLKHGPESRDTTKPFDESKKDDMITGKMSAPCSEPDPTFVYSDFSSLLIGCNQQLCPQKGEGVPDVFHLQWRKGSEAIDDSSQLRTASLLDFDDNDLAEFEEARAVTVAQLDLAFDCLSIMPIRGLPTDADAFKSLMGACGRCGNTSRAMQLFKIMKRDGFVADSEIYSCFINAFAHEEGVDVIFPGEAVGVNRGESDAYAKYLTKKVNAYKASNDNWRSEKGISDTSDESESSTTQNASVMVEMYNALFGRVSPKKKNERKAKKSRKLSVLSPSRSVGMSVPSSVKKQVVLGESLLEYLYPDLTIDMTSDACPQCSNILGEGEIVSGWNSCAFEDFTTQCPQCKHRFVPRFAISTSSPTFEGSQGKGTPLYCEFLSPWVLRKELEHVINGSDGVQGMLNPEWREGTNIRATLWWNLICAFNRYSLPVSFLLQGSFQNRLIFPTPDS